MSDNKHGIKKLNDFQHARKRINMYLGPNTPHTQSIALFDTTGYSIVEQTWIPAAFTSLREIVDNSLDEFVKANIQGTLKVQYDEDTLTFEISDNGRGIPIDWDPLHNCNLATMVLSELKAGRNFDDSERIGVGGMNGIGASAVCQVSEYMDLEIIREGTPLPTNRKPGRYKFTQRFEEGKRYLTDDLVKLDPVITSTRSDKTGTTIKFRLSPDVFTYINDVEYKGKILPTNMVRSLLMEISVNQPLHKIYLNGEKLSPKSPPDKAWFTDYKPMILPINTPGFVSTFYIVPDGAPEWFMHSTVNNIPVFDGGPHVSAFKTTFALGVIKALEKESKRKKLKPNRLDVEQSLFVYNITVMDAPFFTSQAKTKLSNDEVERTVIKAMTDEYFDELVKKNKPWVNSIFERCSDRTNKKDADDVAKQAKKMLKQKIAKLSDATGKRGNVPVPVAEKMLFLTEGDCLQEDTTVYVLTNDGFKLTPINKVVVGDHVVTDGNRLMPVVAIATKVATLTVVNTPYGPIKATPEHRLLVADTNGNFSYKMIKDLVAGIDRLVRNKIVEHTSIDKIHSIIDSDSDQYDVKIILESGIELYATNAHRFGVIHTDTGEFSSIEVRYLTTEYGIVFK